MLKTLSLSFILLHFLISQNDNSEFNLDKSLEELLSIKIVTASGVEEKLIDAPASMIIIEAKDIKERAYSSLSDVLLDLPGFDISVTNGTHYLNAYQRGYRTAWTQRTLFMINNKVDNHLWMHSAQISRQYPLSMIKRIEVLYGPASAVYGANAFLGIINVITYDGDEARDDETDISSSYHIGSYNTRSIDLAVKGKKDDLKYLFSYRLYRSDEEDLSKKWGFLSNSWYSNEAVWGPILKLNHYDKSFGSYHDPTDDMAIFASIKHKNLGFEYLSWVRKEAYGALYTADRAQNNTFWTYKSSRLSLEYEKEIDELTLKTLISYRESDVFNGQWAEATPDWNPGKSDSSFVSLTYWNSLNNSWLFKQSYILKIDENIVFSGGIKYERKQLTKAYDIPGYWQGSYSSTTKPGEAVIHSRENNYTVPSMPLSKMPNDNLILTEDLGGFFQYMHDIEKFRFSVGLRYDENSIYGVTFNPRLTTIYKIREKTALKFIYGEAFQEPPPLQLWGGWQGRAANPNLKPEKVRSYEFVFFHHQASPFPMNHELALYYSKYDNVIKEEAENAGKRMIYGFEYKLGLYLKNPFYSDNDIKASINLSYVKSLSEITYNHNTNSWDKKESDLGDMAPWKLHFNVQAALNNWLDLNLRGHYISARNLYSRNALRAKSIKADSYLLLNTNINLKFNKFIQVSFLVKNLTNKQYYHPGVEHADGGNDFSQRSKGFRNSLVPQESRNYLFTLKFNF